MSSNEEYLDSLLRSVTAKEQAGNGGLSNALNEDTGEKVSSDALEQMLSSEESFEDSFLAIEDIPEDDEDNFSMANMEEDIIAAADSMEEDLIAMADSTEEDIVATDSMEEDIMLAADSMQEDIMAAVDGAEEDIIAAADSMEEDIMAAADSVEEDITATADSMQEDIVAAVDGAEEDIIAAADSMEEDIMAAADSAEEDITATADSMQEDIMAAVDGAEEDIIAAADSMEEDIVASADNMEEDFIFAADNTEEDLIAAADSVEEDLIAMADSVEEMPDTGLEDEGFKEINDLLASSGDSDDDMFALLEGVGNEEEGAGIDIGFFDEEESADAPLVEEESKKEKKERKKREKKEKKKNSRRNKKQQEEAEEGAETEVGAEAEPGMEEMASSEKKEKKPGIFKRFVDFLMEEDDEEEDGKVRVPIDEAEDLFVGEETGENEAILQELNNEDASKKSGKEDKKDKKKKKKGKKGKNEEADSENNEEELEEEDGKEKKKAKKEKKKKKEKEKVAIEEIPEKPGKKISVKKIEVTVVFCLTILAAILLAVNLIPPTLEKNEARDAYYAKDYEKVVEGFYNEELSESDSLMYNRAYTILRLQRKIDGYNNYMRMGKETEALNQLIEGVLRYNEIYPEAEKYNVTAEVDELYQMIEDALENKYGISTTVAEGLYSMEDNLAYTLKLESIINGTEYVEPVYDEEAETQVTEE